MSTLFLLIFLFILRLLFVAPLPIYFDGPEYIRLIQNRNLLQALTVGHEPIHPGFILPAWLLNKILPWGSVYNSELFTSICSALSLFVFYKITRLLFNRQISLRAVLIASLLPVLWLVGINVMVDSVYILFYLLALYCFLVYLQGKRKTWFLFGIISLGYSIFTHVQVLIWLSVFLAPLFLKRYPSRQLVIVLVFLILGIFLGVIGLMLTELAAGTSLLRLLHLLVFHGGDFIASSNPMYEMGVYVRNLGVTLLRNNSTLIVLGAALGGVILYRNDKKKLGLVLLWIVPVLLTSQYWHIGLFGRVSVLASFPIAILVAQIRSRILFGILVCNLILISLPLVIANKNSHIHKELQSLYKSIPKDSVLVSSNLIRPQVTFTGEVYFINEPGQDINFIVAQIEKALMQNKKVYVDSQALFNPYYSLDGNNLHVLSLGKAGHSSIKPLFQEYTISIVKIIDLKSRVFLYQIIKKNSHSTYELFSYSQEIQNIVHPLRYDYFDMGTWMWYLLTNKKDPTLWTIADKSDEYELPSSN